MLIKKALKYVDNNYSDYLIWLVAVAGMFGSLYFSEVKQMPPCTLCWYQRILLYPFVAIYAVGILRKDRNVAYYGLPLAIIGLIMSFYQTLLQWGWIKESSIACSASSAVSCADADFKWLGFITIPFLSFMAFLMVSVLIGLRLYILRKNPKN